MNQTHKVWQRNLKTTNLTVWLVVIVVVDDAVVVGAGQQPKLLLSIVKHSSSCKDLRERDGVRGRE